LTDWRVELTRAAQRDLRRLDPQVRRRIVDALGQLESERPAGDIRKLAGTAAEWRLRVGEWRVRFTRDRDRRIVYVERILPRGRTYRA
jgi:mRNA interferase RelE/StbE